MPKQCTCFRSNHRVLLGLIAASLPLPRSGRVPLPRKRPSPGQGKSGLAGRGAPNAGRQLRSRASGLGQFGVKGCGPLGLPCRRDAVGRDIGPPRLSRSVAQKRGGWQDGTGGERAADGQHRVADRDAAERCPVPRADAERKVLEREVGAGRACAREPAALLRVVGGVQVGGAHAAIIAPPPRRRQTRSRARHARLTAAEPAAARAGPDQ